MAAAFPLLKLGSILVKQISKPLSNYAKKKAKDSPFFRNYICIPPAQSYHWVQVKVAMASKNVGKEIKIPPLKESKAVDLGAGLVGDAVIVSVGVLLLLLEMWRRKHNRSIKELNAKEQMLLMIQDLKQLYMRNAQLEQKVDVLCNILQEHLKDVEVDYQLHTIKDEEALPEHLMPRPKEELTKWGKTLNWLVSTINQILTFL